MSHGTYRMSTTRRKRRKWILLGVLVALVAWAAAARLGGPTVSDGSYLLLDIEGSYAESRPNGLIAQLLEERESLVELLDLLATAGRDSRLAGVVVRIGSLETGWGQLREIRDALVALRERDKSVVAFLGAEAFGGNKEYYLASAADKIYLAPAATPMLSGLSAQYYFLGGMWEKAHLAVEVEQIREYKTFGDMLAGRRMTAAHREMADSILDDVYGEFVSAIASSRHLSEQDVRAVVDSCPASSTDFAEASLADGVLFFDELATELGGKAPVSYIDSEDYARVSPGAVGLGGGPKLAVIHAAGTIVPGKGGKRSAIGMTVGSETLTDAFRTAAEDSSIEAIVFRVDSPGGSASASDAVWRSVRLARERKPVVASFGDVAASGGYYMASGADRILADATTLTGSIGVVLFKPNIGGMLDWAGIGAEGLGRGRYARILDSTKGLDKDEIGLLRAQMEGVYRRFLDRVAVGRQMSVEEVDQLGGGRVWTGRQAQERRLIDEIGGLREAIRVAAVQAGIEDVDSVTVVYLPEGGGVLEELSGLQSSGAASWMPASLLRSFAALWPYATLEAGIHAAMAWTVQIR
jgi:protease-4